MTATGNRLRHSDPEVEARLSALESAGLLIVTHTVVVGTGARTAGWFKVHCPRGCHGALSLMNKAPLSPLVRQTFRWWVAKVLSDHDQADIEGS